jgi:hypothetical protein
MSDKATQFRVDKSDDVRPINELCETVLNPVDGRRKRKNTIQIF